MTHAVWQDLLLLPCAAFVAFCLHFVTWRLLRWLTYDFGWQVLAREPRAWQRLRPLRTWLRLRLPRLNASLAARLKPTRFTGLPLSLLVAGALYLAALLGGLTEDVIEAGAVLRSDQAVNGFFEPWRGGPLIPVFLWITALGAGPALTAVATVATGFLWAGRRPVYILPLWAAFLGAQATTWSGKYLVGRHRPDFIKAVSEVSPSFPSGHATASLALYGFLAYALVRDEPYCRERFEVAFWTAALIAVIGFSRVFLSLHYTTDVLAGFMVGAFWLLVGFALAEWGRLHRAAPLVPGAKTVGNC